MSEKKAPAGETIDAEVLALRERVAAFELLEAEYKTANKQLADKEAFNFALFQYNPVLTIVVDTEGRVIKSNKAKISSGDRLPNIGDIMYKDYASRHRIDMNLNLMECISSGTTGYVPELEYDTKILSITISPFPGGAIPNKKTPSRSGSSLSTSCNRRSPNSRRFAACFRSAPAARKSATTTATGTISNHTCGNTPSPTSRTPCALTASNSSTPICGKRWRRGKKREYRDSEKIADCGVRRTG
jgi:hypothetical protein